MLPLEQAIHWPIHVFTKTDILSSSGEIQIKCNVVEFGMIRWGVYNTFRSKGKTIINNNGKMCFYGRGSILKGSEISVFPTGVIEIGDKFFIGENVRIFCQNSITLGLSVRISYCCDVSDSDYHYIVDTETNVIKPKNRPIVLGDYNWIGSQTAIKKGTITPSHTMVASAYAVLSKDYTGIIPPYSILGGCPARLIKSNSSRVWYREPTTIKEIDELIQGNKEIVIPANKTDLFIQNESC